MLIGNEQVSPTAQSTYYDNAKAVPQGTGKSVWNGFASGFATPFVAVDEVKNAFSSTPQPSIPAKMLLDSIQIDQQRPNSSGVGYFIGDIAGFALNPLNLAAGGAGGAVGGLIGSTVAKVLPAAASVTARTVGVSGGAFAGAMIPTDVVSNYNADTNHINYGGMAESLGINMGIGMALPAIPFALGSIAKRIKAGRETKSAINAADSALAANDITKAEHEFYTAYTNKEDPGKLETLAQNLVRESGQPLDAATGKVPATMLEPKDAQAIQGVLGDQLANDLPHDVKSALSDYIVNSKLDSLTSNPKLIDGLKGYVDHIDQKLVTRETTLAAFDKQLDKYIGKQLHADAPLNQKELYKLVKAGKLAGHTVPKQVEDLLAAEKKLLEFAKSKKISLKEIGRLEKFTQTQQSSARIAETKAKLELSRARVAELETSHATLSANLPHLLHPKDELQFLRESMTGKNLTADLKTSRDYHRLLDLTNTWHNAKSVLYRVHNEHAYEKQAAFKQVAENIIKLSESNAGKLADDGAVRDYLKGRLDSKIFKRSADPVPEAKFTEKAPENGVETLNEQLTSAAEKHGDSALVQEAATTVKRFEKFKQSKQALDDFIACVTGKVNA